MGRKVTRWQASGLHLAISAAIGAVALAIMLLVWYPWPLFHAEGGTELLFILLAVDVILGPIITLIVFRQGKRGMRFDLVVIGVTQLAALLYGMHIVFIARPAFLVFIADRFEVARAVELEPEELAKAKFPQFSRPPFDGPKLAYAAMPSDPAKRQELVMKAFAGVDLNAFPEYWVPYSERRKEVLAAAMTLERARAAEPENVKSVEAWLAASGRKEGDLRYVLLRARRAWVWVVLDARSAEIVKMILTEKI